MKDARCSYCGTYVNNGEFDWVLAEITQEESYGGTADIVITENVLDLDPSISIQVLEDKASNAFFYASADRKCKWRF